MKLDSAARHQLFEKFSASQSSQDTGSPESQIALFTHRIKHLTGHISTHKKDKASRLGLIKLVGKRKRMLKYLQQSNLLQYRAITTALGLRTKSL